MNNNPIDIKQLRQGKAALAELWEFLELPDQMPDVSLWLMDFGKDMIESAFNAMKRRLEAGTKIQSPKNYLFTILDNAKLADMTPEERLDQISQIRSLAGTLGARKKHQNELKKVREELAAVLAKPQKEVLPEVCQTLPDEVEVEVEKRLETDSRDRTATPVDACLPANSKSSKPITKTKTKTNSKVKTCKRCGGILPKDKPCPCYTNGGAAPKPPVAASQDAPRPVLCMDCSELVDRCICAISDSPCEWCGIPHPDAHHGCTRD